MDIVSDKIFDRIMNSLHHSKDFIVRDIIFANISIKVLYLCSITDNKQTYQSILEPLQSFEGKAKKDIITQIKSEILTNNEVKDIYDETKAVHEILKGFVVLIIENQKQMIAVDAEKITVRNIQVPPTSTVTKGPREGFNESLKMNLSMLRRRMATEKLVVEFLEVGKLTRTCVAITYLEGVADKNIAKKISERIRKIDIDGIVDSYYIAEFLKKRPYSMFKQIGDCEKPDILCAKLLEGRVGIMVDGSPIVLTLPFILMEDLQDSDDYYHQHQRAWFIRIVRLIGVVLAVLLPGTYVAIELYHYKIMPTEFLVTLLNTTSGIPFNPFAEILFVILLFEILYEANLRMPQYLGLALSIVGALILGETAVNAGLVSPPAVMIVAVSGLTFYTIPSQAGQFSTLRLILVFVGGILGMYGIILSCVFIVSYLSSFDSYSSAYLAPTAPYIVQDQKDFILKQNITDLNTRPFSIANNRLNNKRKGKWRK